MFGPKKSKNRKGDSGPKSALLRKSYQKVNVGLSVADAEPGSAASGPDRIHAQPGLPELVAFSVPLHSNKGQISGRDRAVPRLSGLQDF